MTTLFINSPDIYACPLASIGWLLLALKKFYSLSSFFTLLYIYQFIQISLKRTSWVSRTTWTESTGESLPTYSMPFTAKVHVVSMLITSAELAWMLDIKCRVLKEFLPFLFSLYKTTFSWQPRFRSPRISSIFSSTLSLKTLAYLFWESSQGMCTPIHRLTNSELTSHFQDTSFHTHHQAPELLQPCSANSS